MALAGRLRDPVNGNIGILDLKDLPVDPAGPRGAPGRGAGEYTRSA